MCFNPCLWKIKNVLKKCFAYFLQEIYEYRRNIYYIVSFHHFTEKSLISHFQNYQPNCRVCVCVYHSPNFSKPLKSSQIMTCRKDDACFRSRDHCSQPEVKMGSVVMETFCHRPFEVPRLRLMGSFDTYESTVTFNSTLEQRGWVFNLVV